MLQQIDQSTDEPTKQQTNQAVDQANDRQTNRLGSSPRRAVVQILLKVFQVWRNSLGRTALESKLA